MNAPLVVFGEDWGGHPSSTQHLIRRLMVDRAVVWVNSIGLRRPRLNTRDLRRAAIKLRAAFRSAASGREPEVKQDSKTPVFKLIAPLAVPAASGRLARTFNRILLSGAIRRVLQRHGLHDPILWMSLPTAVDVGGGLGERAIVYYCGDDFSALSGVDHEPVSLFESELVKRADLVFAASPAIASKFPRDKTVLVPHGVDLQQFGARKDRSSDLPKNARVAGFYGSLSEWIDCDLLAKSARLLPEWIFLLIGPVQTDTAPLNLLPNIVLAGPRRHEELPGYVQHWDVSLLPFRDTGQIRSCNPLKLREYFAAGTPVVSTDFPALDGYRDLIRVARTPAEFAAAIRLAGEEGRRLAHERMNRVASETWEARARQVSSLLATL